MNGHSFTDTIEATEHLKNILNLNGEKSESSAVTVNSAHPENDHCKLEESTNSKIIESGNLKLEKESPEKKMAESNSANLANENVYQKLELNGEDVNLPIYGTDVSVISSPLHRPPSLKVMMHNVVDFGWEYRSYVGHIMTVHISTKYLAYSLKSPISESGFVRVMKQQDSQDTLLIRGFKGILKDLAFAYSLTRVILACVDEFGQLLVYEILDNGANLSSKRLLHIARKEGPSLANTYHRIFWCPFVPYENSSDDDLTLLLCLTQDEKAEILKIDTVMKENDDDDILYFENLKTNGYLTMAHHSKPITTAAFSPDGIALATASLDGEVKFFQINSQENDDIPKYLHQWNPHYGKPLSSLFFLDNIKDCDPDAQFWKCAITGADNNQELKLWSCKTWVCLQTISFKPNANDTTIPLLKPEVDLSGRYLFLSDISRKVLYVLRIRQDAASEHSFICSLSEFAVKFPVLNIFCTNVCKAKSSNKANENEEDDEDDDGKDDDSDDISETTERKTSDYLIKLYWVTTKSLQSCRVIYQPKSESPVLSLGSTGSSQDSFVYRDGFTELLNVDNENPNVVNQNSTPTKCLTPADLSSVLTPSAAVVGSLASEHSYYKGCDDILLRPKDFTSSSHSNLLPVNIGNTFKLPGVEEVCSNLNVEISQDNQSSGTVSPCVPSSPDVNVRKKSSQHSSSSSPSREVAEILSPRQLLNHDALTPSEEKEADLVALDPTEIHSSSTIRNTPSNNRWALDTNAHWNDSDVCSPPDQSRHSLPHIDAGDNSPLMREDQYYQFQSMEQEIKSLKHKISSMSKELHEQNQGIHCVRSNLHEVGQQQKYIQNNLQNFITVATNLLTKFEKLSEANNAGYVNVENLFEKWNNNEKLRTDRQTTVLMQKLSSEMNLHIDKSVIQEMKSTIIPHITSYIDTTVGRMEENLRLKLVATDSMMRECITKHLKSKAFAENVSMNISGNLQQSIQDLSRETFQNCIIPAFEKSCQILIKQMNEIFVTGTAEYIQHMDRRVTSICSNFETTFSGVQNQLHKMTSEANGALNKQTTKLQEYIVENAKQNDLLITKIRQVVQDEIHRSLREETLSYISERSQTPSPATHSKEKQSTTWNDILPLIKTGQINEAFKETLTAVDLELLMQLCEYVSVDEVFCPGTCILAQHVLLSLVHQLVMSNLNDKTDVKVRYIEDAIASLDSNNPVTKQHIGPVVQLIEQKITVFMQKNPSHLLNRHFRRIILSSKSLLK